MVLLTACGGGGAPEPAASETAATSAAATAAQLTADAAAESALLATANSMDASAAGLALATEPTRAAVASAGAAAPGDEQRAIAAQATAEALNNACSAIRPFYWEIGRADGRLAAGSPTGLTDGTAVLAHQPMAIASASKWLYASWVVQRRAGEPTAGDRKALSMRTGYTTFTGCTARQTVGSCQASGNNDLLAAATEGLFFYGGGHMQKHASLAGLESMNNEALAAEMKRVLGSDVPLVYAQPQLAGGVVTTANSYAVFLRKLLGGQLAMGGLLGSQPVCTNPNTCARQALYAPSPAGVSWHYTLGHWVEDDPLVGDGAFSSAGAFGFYPWIDAGRSTYGVVARSVTKGALGSIACGQLIRQAWMSGVAR